MIIRGRVENRVVVLEGSTFLPEGAEVSVLYPATSTGEPEKGNSHRVAKGPRIRLPLVPSKQPGSRQLTAERVAELLEEDDLSA